MHLAALGFEIVSEEPGGDGGGDIALRDGSLVAVIEPTQGGEGSA